MASSAPELAEKYKLRPTQIQRRLDKLQKNEMLCSVIGSTDGFENYRLTESGLALIAVCERQATARASVVSV
jgi:DNA-binding MarR family transcriptional regulator